MIEFTVTENLSEQRLDKVLRKVLREAPDSFIYRMLREKNITLNGKRAQGSDRTAKGDVIRFFFSEETYRKMRGQDRAASRGEVPGNRKDSASEADHKEKDERLIPEIIHEDDDVLLFVKPQGLKSQKASSGDWSANDWVLMKYAERGNAADDGFRPSIVNRLDRNTGGIMAAGMSAKGLRILSELFRERDLGKFYLTIVSGEAPESMKAHAFLRKAGAENRSEVSMEALPGSVPIETDWVRLRYDPVQNLSLLRVELVTGKRHQIRAHLSFLGYPVLGDPKYGEPQRNRKFKLPFQCLFCERVTFPECGLPGVSGKTFSAAVPKDWPLRPEGEKS